MDKPEILAPAGGFEALVAAVRCGADAVYLGGKTLNARRSASNFDDDALFNAAEYCRARGVKLYLTLNTLAADNEIEEAIKAVKRACAIGVDALILQDIGLAALVRDCCDLPMHASTQMSVQTPSGLAPLQDMGFRRAVLPRELTKDEIEAAVKLSPIETEVFVHGALCMSVSGQCYLSAVLGARSGNRGLCAQPCRLPFTAQNGTGHDLSLKDLSLLHALPELAKTGVTSFKIEGRMKRPEYVAAAVTACRMALDGAVTQEIEAALKSVFSRSGFTDGYYMDKRGREMFGTRRHEDVASAAPVLSGLAKLYEKEPQTVPVKFAFDCESGKPMKLSASARGQSFEAMSQTIPSPAVKRELTITDIKVQLSKCGGTCFYVEKIDVTLGEGLYVSLSELNALRREALEGLEKILTAPPKREIKSSLPTIQPHKAGKRSFYARFSSAAQIPDNLENIKKIILPLYCDKDDFIKYNAAVELPRGIFGASEAVNKKLTALKEIGVTHAVCGTLDGVALAKKAGLTFSLGFGSNLYNSYAVAEAARQGAEEVLLSAELTANEAARVGGELPRGVFAYGCLPLMLTRNCPAANGQSCAECGRSGALTDRLGIIFPIDCRSGCAEVLNSRPVYMADKIGDIKNADFLLMYFTTERKPEVEDILNSYRLGLPPEGEFTRGLFYRGTE